MRRWTLALAALVAAFMIGCPLDALLLSSEQREAMEETKASRADVERVREDLARARAELAEAKTEEERAAAEARSAIALERLEAAEKRAEAAGAKLDLALEKGGSLADVGVSLLNNWVPWLAGLVGTGLGIYQRSRAKKAKGERDVASSAFTAAARGVEEFANETEKGKDLKKKLSKEFEKAGVTPWVDGSLRVLGVLRKSA